MEDKSKIYLFEEAPIAGTVIKMAVPTVISSLVMVLYNLADTYFVGMLNDPIQNAAVTLAAPLLLAFNAVNNLFGVGSSSLMSRCLGVRNYDKVKRVSVFGFYCSAACGIIFSLIYICTRGSVLKMLGTDASTYTATANYLRWTVACGAAPAILNVVMAYLVRSEGATLHAGIGTMSGCILNIILDPFFIMPWGLNLGAAGAGLATFISNCFACLYFFVLIYVKRRSTYVCINPKKFKLDKSITRDVCIVGIPAAIQNLLNVTGMTILNNFTSVYGADAVAAMGIVQKINMVPMYVAMGFSQGVMPLVSYTYSSKNYRRMKDTVLISARIIISFMLAATFLFRFGSEFFVRLFIENEEVVAYGTKFLSGMCLGITLLSIDFLAVGIFQAVGAGLKALAFAVTRKIIMEIPALIILNRLFPLYGLAYAQPAAELVMAIAAVITLYNLFEKTAG